MRNPETGTTLTIALPEGSDKLDDARLGDSIAVNGVCLTATEIRRRRRRSERDGDGDGDEDRDGSGTAGAGAPAFTVGVAPETLRLTDLGGLRRGSRVNVERAARADTRMGGHFVQGHVDATAEIVAARRDGEALVLRFRPRDPAVLRHVVFKGFVAVDGASLTVTRVVDEHGRDGGGGGGGGGHEYGQDEEGGEGGGGGGWWEVMLIAYTQEKITLARKAVGDTVNVEVDVLAKYAEKSVAGLLLGPRGEAQVKSVIEKMVQDLVTQAMGARSS